MKERHIDYIRHVFLILLSLVLLVPFYIAIINAFKPRLAIATNPLGIPFSELTLDNFSKVAITSNFNIFKAYQTSFLITSISIVLIIIIGAMMSYVIARNNNKWMLSALLILLAAKMIPPQVVLIPMVKMLSTLGLMFTSQGLILYNIGWFIPFTVFVFTGFIRTISMQLDESAKMDGANHFTIFWRIIFPLIRPATASVIIFLFIFIWNDFLSPLIILGSGKGYTITTGIYFAIGQFSVKWEEVYALVVLASLPIVIVFMFMQRYFISGLTGGALKG